MRQEQNNCQQDMGGRGAVVANSGETVDNSVPVVIRPTTPVRDGRKPYACPPEASNALIDHDKSGWGLGGKAPKKEKPCEAAQISSSSLDYIQTNRNTPPELRRNILGRKRYCGVWTIIGKNRDEQKIGFIRVNCKTWDCAYCGPKRARRFKAAIRANAEKHGLNRFVCLTLDPKKIASNPVMYLRQVFNKFRTYLKRRFGVSVTFIAVLEFQKNGNPHLHLLIDRFIPQAWISETWSTLGGGKIADIRYVDIHHVSHYLSKYLTKELLLSAPKGSRRVTTSRDIHLIEKLKKEITWILLRVSIFDLFNRLSLLANDIRTDEEEILESFSIAS